MSNLIQCTGISEDVWCHIIFPYLANDKCFKISFGFVSRRCNELYLKHMQSESVSRNRKYFRGELKKIDENISMSTKFMNIMLNRDDKLTFKYVYELSIKKNSVIFSGYVRSHNFQSVNLFMLEYVFENIIKFKCDKIMLYVFSILYIHKETLYYSRITTLSYIETVFQYLIQQNKYVYWTKFIFDYNQVYCDIGDTFVKYISFKKNEELIIHVLSSKHFENYSYNPTLYHDPIMRLLIQNIKRISSNPSPATIRYHIKIIKEIANHRNLRNDKYM